jgi:hypothetical protein
MSVFAVHMICEDDDLEYVHMYWLANNHTKKSKEGECVKGGEMHVRECVQLTFLCRCRLARQRRQM